MAPSNNTGHEQSLLESLRYAAHGINAPFACSGTLLQGQARDVQARRALQAFQQMRRIIAGAETKLDLLEQLFRRHASDRAIVFTANNEVTYKISRQFLIAILPPTSRRHYGNLHTNGVSFVRML